MVATTSPLARLALLAAPLLAARLAAPAALPQQHQQMVLGGSDGSAKAQEPDFVDVLVAEAEAAGRTDELMEKWGFSAEDIKVSMSAWKPVAKGSSKKKTAGAAKHAVLEAGLGDASERAKLLAEAAADDALVWIQPTAPSSPHAPSHGDASASDGPGSGWVWNVCGSGQEGVVLHTLDVAPDPPVAGKNLTVHATGTVHTDITEGTYADVVVKLGFIRLLTRRFDVCQLAEDNNAELKCPLAPGEYEMTHTVELPREIPPAKFNVHATGKTANDEDLMCMDVVIDFGRH